MEEKTQDVELVEYKNAVNAEDRELESAINSALENDPLTRKKIVRIAYDVSRRGLTLEDACALARISMERFEALCEKIPQLAELMRIKELRYKADLVGIISNQALSNGDSTKAAQLLERRFPHEFDNNIKKILAKQGAQETGTDAFEEILLLVRRSNTSSTPVDPKVGKSHSETPGIEAKRTAPDVFSTLA